MMQFSYSVSEPTLFSGVYCIRNRYNGKVYIGSAHHFQRRWNLHRTNLRAGNHHSRHLQRSWDKWGAEAFEFLVLERCPKSEVIAAEQFWLNESAAHYNSSPTAGSRAGAKNSSSHNQAIAEKARQRWANPEYKARLRKALAAAIRPTGVRTTRSHLITAYGQTKALAEWARQTGIKRETIAYRIRSGKSPEQALCN